MNYYFRLFAIAIFILVIGCKSSEKKKQQQANEINTQILKKDSSNQVIEKIVERAPVINLSDSFLTKGNVIFISGKSERGDSISIVLDSLFSKLNSVVEKEKLKVKSPRIVWYKSLESPFTFEAGYSVDGKIANIKKPFSSRAIGGDSAVVAHYFGPYSSTTVAYEYLNEWLNDHGKTKSKPAYEVYIDNPKDENGKAKNPYKVQTDIVVPYK